MARPEPRVRVESWESYGRGLKVEAGRKPVTKVQSDCEISLGASVILLSGHPGDRVHCSLAYKPSRADVGDPAVSRH